MVTTFANVSPDEIAEGPGGADQVGQKARVCGACEYLVLYLVGWPGCSSGTGPRSATGPSPPT